MKAGMTRFLGASLAFLLATGCYRTTELCDPGDTRGDPADVPGEPGDPGDAVDGVDPGDPGDGDATPDEDRPKPDAGPDEADLPPPRPAAAWFASFRCPSLAGPLHPGAGIPAETCLLAIRASQAPAVDLLEIHVGTGRLASISHPAETEELQVKWGAFPGREIVLRAKAVLADGTETEDIVPIRTLPDPYDPIPACGTGLALEVTRPDNWESPCGHGRLVAALDWTPDGFGPSPTQWRIQATLGGKAVAEVPDRVADVAFEVPAGKTGVQALEITGTAWLPVGGCCAGPEPCALEVVRHLVVTPGGEGCAAPACDVVLDGPSDGVVEGDAWLGTVRLEPPVDGATVRVFVDPGDAGTEVAAPGTFEATGLRDGFHEVRALARLPDGGTCSDRARFVTDAVPPVITLPQDLPANWDGTVSVKVSTRDVTVVNLDPDPRGQRTCESPEPRASGVVEWTCRVPMPANAQQATVRVSGRDAAGHVARAEGLATTSMLYIESLDLEVAHYHPTAQGPVHDLVDGEPWVVFGRAEVRVALRAVGLTYENLLAAGLEVTVDGQPAAEAGLSLRLQDVASDVSGRNAVVDGIWDTTRIADGPHRLAARLTRLYETLEAGVDVEVRSGSLPGLEPGLLRCDTAFTSCTPLGDEHVAGDVGIRADVSWWGAADDPVLRIRAAGEDVATCTGRTCDWVLRWDEQPRGALEVAVEAVGTGDRTDVRLGTSRRVVRDLHDLDDDGFRGLADGGLDCDDGDPATFPGAPDPVGAGCQVPGAPVRVALSEAPGDIRVLDAARDPSGTLHVILCDPGDRAFRLLRAPADGPVEAGEPVGVGSADCATAVARFGRAADGGLRLALAPGDGTAGFAALDDDFPPVPGEIPTFGGRLAAVIPDGVLAIQGLSLVAHRQAAGSWAATTLLSRGSSQDPAGHAAATVAPDGTVHVAVRLGYDPTLIATLPATGVPVFEGLPQDALGHVSGMPAPSAYGYAGWPMGFDEGVGLGRDAAGRLVVLEGLQMPFPIVADGASNPPLLWTGGPDLWRARGLDSRVREDDGPARYVLRVQPRASLGVTVGGEPVVASRTTPLDQHFPFEPEWPAWLQVVVPRGDGLAALPQATGLDPDDPVVVGGGTGAAEVVLRDDRAGKVLLLAWPCATAAAADTDCDGVDGPGGPPCEGACTADLDAANRVAGSMPLCEGGVSDGVWQAGESCDGGTGGMAVGCRDCDFRDIPLDLVTMGASGGYAGPAIVGRPDGTALLATTPWPGREVRLLSLDPDVGALGIPATLPAPSGRVFSGQPLVVQRSADIVVLAGTWTETVGEGEAVQAFVLDAGLQVAGSTVLDAAVSPRVGTALSDGRVAFAGGPLGGAIPVTGQVLVADPANPVTELAFSWELHAENRSFVPLALREGPDGNLVLLRSSATWSDGGAGYRSTVWVTTLAPSPWRVRAEWTHEWAGRIDGGSLVPLGPAGYLVSWTEDDLTGQETDPALPRVVRAQRLDLDLAPMGDVLALDAFRWDLLEGPAVTAVPLPPSQGTGVAVVWARPDRVGGSRVTTMRASVVQRDGTASDPVAVFDVPLYAAMFPGAAVAGPDALVVVAAFEETVERARFVDPRRAFGMEPLAGGR